MADEEEFRYNRLKSFLDIPTGDNRFLSTPEFQEMLDREDRDRNFPRSEFVQQQIVQDVLERVQYKENWAFTIHQPLPTIIGALRIDIQTIDSTTHNVTFLTHTRPIPTYIFNLEAAEEWILQNIIEVEKHEAMEFFKVGGRATYLPDHTPGGNPYAMVRKG